MIVSVTGVISVTASNAVLVRMDPTPPTAAWARFQVAGEVIK